MCQTCDGYGVIYKNLGFGIELQKCQNCVAHNDPCAELRKRIAKAKKEWGETHEPAS